MRLIFSIGEMAGSVGDTWCGPLNNATPTEAYDPAAWRRTWVLRLNPTT